MDQVLLEEAQPLGDSDAVAVRRNRRRGPIVPLLAGPGVLVDIVK
jgi:hypothetical protein